MPFSDIDRLYISIMSERRKARSDHPYFVTSTVVGWIDVFTRKRYCEIVLESLEFCIQYKGLDLFSYVIMPSHIHFIARSRNSKLPGIIRDIKRHTANKILGSIKHEPGESRKSWLLHMFKYHAKFSKQNIKYMFWQKTNHPTMLDYPAIFDQKIDYIHNNPSVAGYTTDPYAWNYSSANPFQRLRIIREY